MRELIWAEGRASLCEDVPSFSSSRPSDRNRMQVMRNSCLIRGPLNLVLLPNAKKRNFETWLDGIYLNYWELQEKHVLPICNLGTTLTSAWNCFRAGLSQDRPNMYRLTSTGSPAKGRCKMSSTRAVAGSVICITFVSVVHDPPIYTSQRTLSVSISNTKWLVLYREVVSKDK